MQQWVVDIAYDTMSGPRTVTESFYLPTQDDVRMAVSKKGGYALAIRAHQRSTLERLLARSTWWQVQLLRGIQFRSTSTSPGVAFWKIIEAETNPRRQNILAPAREALTRGLGVIDALKALNIFDHGTIAILAGSERANKLVEGIPHAIHSITQKRKNARAIMGTMGWLAFDVFTIISSIWAFKGMVIGWLREKPPTNPDDIEKFENTVNALAFTWDAIVWFSFAIGAFMAWCVFSYWYNRGKQDWPTARIVRRIPLIGGYLRDLSFADSMAAASRMLKGRVPINEALEQSSEASSSPDVAQYWMTTKEALTKGTNLGAALDREPLTRSERLEVASLSDLSQVSTVMESIAEMRAQAAKTKHSLIVWAALFITALILVIALGSAIYALQVMNISMDSVMGGLMDGAL